MNSMKRQKDRTLEDELPSSVGAQYVTGDQWRNNSRKNEGMESKQKQHPVVDVTGDRRKVWWDKEQYCIGTWNVRSVNQGKLKVVKQEMARVNIDILGISELKWTGMGEFNSDDHYIYYCRQESLRRNGVAIMVNKSLKCSIWMQSQKRQNDLCLFPRQTIQHQLLQCYWLGHRFGLLWYWLVCLGNEQRSSVIFEIASKYCILDSFVDYGYSISSKGFLPTVVDIMVIWVKLTHYNPF